MDLDQRLKKRYKALSSIENLIKESIYYRSNNCFFDEKEKIAIGNTQELNTKTKII